MRSSERGFSKLELCLVVTLLVGLAGVTLPRFYSNETDQQVRDLHARLSAVRGAIDAYRNDHGDQLPGRRDGKVGEAIFLSHLMDGSSSDGSFQVRGECGPYLSTAFPVNPFNGLDSVRVVEEGRLPPADGSTGWIYHLPTGSFRANEPGSAGSEDLVLYEL